MQAKLARAEARLTQVIEFTPNGMLLVDQQGLIVLVNERVERLFAYGRAELVGQPVQMLVPGLPLELEVLMGVGQEFVGRRRDGTDGQPNN